MLAIYFYFTIFSSVVNYDKPNEYKKIIIILILKQKMLPD